MHFDILKLSFAILVCSSVFCGCTEKLPLSPVYSNESDWTPAISLYQSGYQRVEVLIDRPTRKELWRNISFLTLQARKSQLPGFNDIDTLKGTYAAPTENYNWNQLPIYFLSKPRLGFDADYAIRLSVRFGTGETHYSNELAVKMPPSIGKVLKRIQFQEGSYDPFRVFLAFYQGSLLFLQNTEIIQVDTGSGLRVSVKRDFRPPSDRSPLLLAFTVLADTAYSFYRETDDYSKSRLISLDLRTLHVDSSTTIATPGKGLTTIMSHRGELYGFWWTSPGNQQAGIINPHTGEVLRWFSETPGFDGLLNNLSSDGINLFYCRTADFDNRIVAVDPVTMNTVKENRNPIFSSICLTWDGANFWVVDSETQTFAKIKLEGM